MLNIFWKGDNCNFLMWDFIILYYIYYLYFHFRFYSSSYLWVFLPFLLCFPRLSINIPKDIIPSKSHQPRFHPKLENPHIYKHKWIVQVRNLACIRSHMSHKMKNSHGFEILKQDFIVLVYLILVWVNWRSQFSI